MTGRVLKRIVHDIEYMTKEEIDKDGIYFLPNEEDMFKMKALIIGPTNTPYEGGFYFFDITFPENYPMKPPKVIHQTRVGKVRFNPNLYANGKVCLSILGTWSGPSWTPTMNILSVLRSIQGMVMNECPLKNEPGYGHVLQSKYDAYNGIIHYWNLHFAILEMAKKPIKGFEMFHSHIIEHLLNKKEQYLTYAQGLATKYAKTKSITCEYQRQAAYNINYHVSIQELQKVIEEFEPVQSNQEAKYDTMKKKELWTICKTKDICITKVSKRTGKDIYKTKAELIKDLNVLQTKQKN